MPLKGSRGGLPGIVSMTAAAGAILALGVLTGLMVVAAPTAAWVLFALVMSLVLVVSPPHIRIAAAVIAAVFSRLAVATGFTSSILNFLHFPLALGAALISIFDSPRISPLRRPLGAGLMGLLAVSVVSWVINGGEIVRPLLDWLVFAEPFLIIYALINMPQEKRGADFLWALSLVIFFGQLPLMYYQAFRLGLSDPVQGFFIGMGAGAHVAGAVCMTGALVCLARAIAANGIEKRIGWLAGVGLLFLATILADAKQVIIPFLPAMILLMITLMKLRVSRVIAATPLLAAGVWGAFSFYRPLQMALDWTLISRGMMGKVEAFSTVARMLSARWSGWLLGLGPGNSISRVAQMGLEAFVKPNSPVAALNLGPAAATRELWNLTTSSRLFSASSVWSGISSWLGIMGDLGLAGLGFFVWMYWSVWRNLRAHSGWEAGAARAVLLMMALLGLLFSWLEEPGFTLMAALVVGLGSRAAACQERSP